MALSSTRPSLGRPYIPGKFAWSMLFGALLLVTFLTVHGADWSNGASSASLGHAGDSDRFSFLTSEIDHAGA